MLRVVCAIRRFCDLTCPSSRRRDLASGRLVS
jgi:hypothetical protein